MIRNKSLIVLLILTVVISAGCKTESRKVDYKSLSITDQITELESRKELFYNFRGTYDDYSEIHDFLYPESKKLDDDIIIDGTTKIFGKELKGKNLKEGKEYLSSKIDGIVDSTEKQTEKIELSISDIYKDKELDWYYIFVMKKMVVSGVETNIPSRYTLEKVNGGYQVLEYNTDYRFFSIGDKDTLKKQMYITYNDEPVTYISKIIIKDLK